MGRKRAPRVPLRPLLVLRAGGRSEASGFYEKLGFSRSTVAMERPARPGPGLPSKLSLLRCPPANDRVGRAETAARAESSAGASTRNTQETGMFTRDTCCTLVPYFEVQDGQLAAFKALGPQFVAKTRTESGCLHYAFSFNGSTAHCREGYANAEALLAHRGDDAATRAAYEAGLAKLKPKFDLYERANRVNAYPWLADLLIWRAQKSHRLLSRMSGVLNETSNPGHLVSLKGISRLFFE